MIFTTPLSQWNNPISRLPRDDMKEVLTAKANVDNLIGAREQDAQRENDIPQR